MKRSAALAIVLISAAVLSSCSHRPPVQSVLVAPRIDLTAYELVGVVQFESNSKGELGPLATRKFEQMARRDQGVVRMVDLGGRGRALGSVGEQVWTPASYRAVGSKHDVKTLFVGALEISNVRPEISLAGTLRSGTVTARVDATLSVQLIETATGASLWNDSAKVTTTVGHLSVLRGAGFAFDAANPDEAYGDLVDALVEQVTRDFRASWVRQ